jgi:hypothetical protein
MVHNKTDEKPTGEKLAALRSAVKQIADIADLEMLDRMAQASWAKPTQPAKTKRATTKRVRRRRSNVIQFPANPPVIDSPQGPSN